MEKFYKYTSEKEKVVAFAGHRFAWQNVGIKEKLNNTLEMLIQKGYIIFYDANNGYFDKLACEEIINLKHKYPQIKLFRILTYYHENKEKYELSDCFDGSILPDIENVFYKQKISKRNEWIVDNCDILVCHIEETFKSGAFKTVQYARKNNKPIIYI